MKLNQENLSKVFNYVAEQIEDDSGRGEFDEETSLLCAVSRTIEMIEENTKFTQEDAEYLVVMDAKEFMENVYDNLMKNTNHNPVDFAKTKGDCFWDGDKNEIIIGKFKLKVSEFIEQETYKKEVNDE
jgi:vacuolar-type H+-ATPase catalytic subunit A/Vma1